MMQIGKTLADNLKEVLLNGKWVAGTNIKNEIIHLDWKTAAMRIDALNSIADLTFHIDYYLSGVLNVFEGGALTIKDAYSFDYKFIESQEDWRQLTDKFCKDSEKFVRAVENMTDEDLNKDFVKKEYGNYLRNIMVMSEHCYYHLGQIILIKKLIENKS